MALAERSGFDVADPARLRPWLYPPVPRASLVAKKLPPGWHREGQNLIPDQPPPSRTDGLMSGHMRSIAVRALDRAAANIHHVRMTDPIAAWPIHRPRRSLCTAASTRRPSAAPTTCAPPSPTPARRSPAVTRPSSCPAARTTRSSGAPASRPNLCLNVEPGAQGVLVGADPDRYFVPAYMGVRGWVGVQLDNDVDWPTLQRLIEESHAFAAPKKKPCSEETVGAHGCAPAS